MTDTFTATDRGRKGKTIGKIKPDTHRTGEDIMLLHKGNSIFKARHIH